MVTVRVLSRCLLQWPWTSSVSSEKRVCHMFTMTKYQQPSRQQRWMLAAYRATSTEHHQQRGVYMAACWTTSAECICWYRLQSAICRTISTEWRSTSAQRCLSNDVCPTMSVQRCLSNEVCPTTSVQRRLSNNVCPTTSVQQRLQRRCLLNEKQSETSGTCWEANRRHQLCSIVIQPFNWSTAS